MAKMTSPVAGLAKPRMAALLVVLTGMILVTGALSLALGITSVPLADLPTILMGEGGERVHRIVIREIRLPRLLAGVTAGAALGVAGAMLQDALRNPLADPGILGVASGGSLVAAAVVILNLPVPAGGLPLAALLGGLATGAVVLATVRMTRDPVRMLLIGAALSALFGALITVLIVLGSPQDIRALTRYLAGSLIGADWEDARILAVWATAGAVLATLLARGLAVLRLGDEVAEGLGLPVARVRGLVFLAAILLTAPVVSQAGPIAFVALIAPHLARGLAGTGQPGVILPLSALGGALMLAACDLAAREILQPAELPVGLVVAGLGGPVAILILRRRVVA